MYAATDTKVAHPQVMNIACNNTQTCVFFDTKIANSCLYNPLPSKKSIQKNCDSMKNENVKNNKTTHRKSPTRQPTSSSRTS